MPEIIKAQKSAYWKKRTSNYHRKDEIIENNIYNEMSIFVHPREKNHSKIIIGLASNAEETFIMGKTGQIRN
jgi:hypothetical protein